MIQTVYLSDFRDAFHKMDRGNQFSYEALELIYDYLEECDDSMELDVIAVCCDFEEMHYSDIIGAYDTDITDTDFDTEEEQIEFVRKYLEDNTSVVGESAYGTFVFSSF